MPTLGGSTLIIPYGVMDQSSVEVREDLLVYTTPPLDQAIEITGPITVTLFAASTAKDTDFTAKLIDLRPDGYAQNLQDGIIRARFRTSTAQPSFLKPGKTYRFDIDLWATSHVVKIGHSIRLEISSSNFPRFDRNPNTGAVLGIDTEMVEAQQAVQHSNAFPSHITLPVIPR